MDKPIMDESLIQLALLLQSRAKAASYYTRELLTMLTPTVITALREVLGLPEDKITWLDVDVIESMLILDAIITVDVGNVPAFVRSITDPGDYEVEPGDEHVEHMIKLGIPVEMAFSDKDTIIAFIKSRAEVVTDRSEFEEKLSEAVAPQKTPQEEHTSFDVFDTSTLTFDQKLSLALQQKSKAIH